jgi:hypothetical protein
LVPGDKDKKKYISYTSGYVRAHWSNVPWYRSKEEVGGMTPLTRATLKTPRERLLLILRRAIDLNKKGLIGLPIFQKWIKDPSQDIDTFMHDNRGQIAAHKFSNR